MKKIILFVLSFVCVLSAFGQNTASESTVIFRNNGAMEVYKASDIQKIYFRNLSASTVGEVVDLGLSVKWASHNIGASAPEDYGFYYTWGEIETKDSYGFMDCFWGEYTKEDLIGEGVINNEGNLTPDNDVATVNWGENWRTPTTAELNELIEQCQWEVTDLNGVKGYKVTGPNSNSIFLPFSGRRFGQDLYGIGTDGCYNSSSIDPDQTITSTALGIWSEWEPETGPDERYEGHSVRPVYIERPRFTITITETTETTVSATITPLNPDSEYLRFCIAKEMFDNLGSDEELFNYFIQTSQSNANKNGMTLREYLETQKRILVGDSEYKIESLKPTTDYYICAVCIDAEIKQAGDMVKQAFTTTDVVPSTVTFDIQYEISGPNVTTTVTPSDENQFWVFDIVRTASIKEEDIAAVYQKVLNDKIKEYQNMFGWSEAKIVSSVIASKGSKTFTDELDAETEYYGFAVSINSVGIINAVPTVKVFTTEKVSGSNNKLELNIINPKDRQAEIQVTTTNDDPYVLIVDKTASFKGLTDEQIIEKLTKYPYKPDDATLKGNQTKVATALEPETEYSAFVFGWFGGIATTTLLRADFTTTAHVEGTASVTLKGVKYYDGTALSDKYPDIFPPHIYAGNAVLPVEVEINGEFTEYFYSIMAGAPATPEGFEEYMYRTLRKQGHNTRTFYLMGGFDTEYTLTGFAVDEEGHYGPILWEKVTFTKDGVSPIAEFTPFE